MSKRGPKPLISHEERLEELQKNDIFYSNGFIKKENDAVWEIICDNLNKDSTRKIKPRNLYTYVVQNRNNARREILWGKLQIFETKLPVSIVMDGQTANFKLFTIVPCKIFFFR